MTTSPPSITVHVNGRPRRLATGGTVADLLRALDLAAPLVAVEVNRAVVARARHAETLLHDGDQVEVVQLVGGG